MLNDDNIGTYTYNYINFNFGVGTSYTKEHLEALAVDLQTFLATKKKLTIKKISLILQSILLLKSNNTGVSQGCPINTIKIYFQTL